MNFESATVINQLLATMTYSTFKREIFQRVPIAFPGSAFHFRKAINWTLVQEILDNGHGESWLTRKGKLPENEALNTGKLSFDDALRSFEGGSSVVIRHAERCHQPFFRIAMEFENAFMDPVDIQLYLSPQGAEAFDWHYDLEEVFVIQCSGEKQFFLRTPNELPPLDRVVIPQTLDFGRGFQPGMSCYLEPGDFLYIPSGTWHKARAISPSFHMSIGVMSSTRHDLERRDRARSSIRSH